MNKTLIFILIICAVLLAGCSNTTSDDTSTESTSQVSEKTYDIDVTFQTVKDVDGKYRYFFDIRNNDDANFMGSVDITLINKKGEQIWQDTFKTNRIIEPTLGASVYTDANTGPTSVHGENGIYKYDYVVKAGGKEINRGSSLLQTPVSEEMPEQPELSESVEPKDDVLETIIFPCDGRAGESFYLFTESDGFDIIKTSKLTCRKEVEILERTCLESEGIEMDKVRQGTLVGWAQRSDLTCKNMYCDRAPDSIC